MARKAAIEPDRGVSSMSIQFTCAQCGKEYTVSDELAGRKARCKDCNAVFIVPAPEDLADHLFEVDSDPSPPPRRDPEPTSSRLRNPASDAGFNHWDWLKPLGTLVLCVGIPMMLALPLLFLNLNNNNINNNLPPAPPPIGVPAEPIAGQTTRFSPRGPGKLVAPGVRCFEVRSSGQPGIATATMTVWLYLPEGRHEPKSLPCVVIAPAGSILITGMDLGAGDRAEHLPYVSAGYAVLAYSLDGNLDDNQATNADISKACTKFIAARAGLSNAKAAIDWMLKNAAEVDPDRIYTAGHSSAGTMALLLAENEPRIKACASFAGRADVGANFKGLQGQLLKTVIPGMNTVVTNFNPSKHADQIQCPVYLFQAEDDTVVPKAENIAFANELKRLGKNVTLDLVATGGHYNSMISQGIPRAIDFFAQNGSRAQAVANE